MQRPSRRNVSAPHCANVVGMLTLRGPSPKPGRYNGPPLKGCGCGFRARYLWNYHCFCLDVGKCRVIREALGRSPLGGRLRGCENIGESAPSVFSPPRKIKRLQSCSRRSDDFFTHSQPCVVGTQTSNLEAPRQLSGVRVDFPSRIHCEDTFGGRGNLHADLGETWIRRKLHSSIRGSLRDLHGIPPPAGAPRVDPGRSSGGSCPIPNGRPVMRGAI
jgi:hypothetical protein